MKNIQKYKLFILLGFALMLTQSCNKTLKEKPYSFLSPNNFYQNEKDAITAINGVYSALFTYDLYIQPFWNLTVLDDDHSSGADWFLGTSGAGNPQGYWGVDGPWKGCYTIIARANTVLENVSLIPDDSIDPEIRTRVLGEAYCLRGWAYFQLVQLYGEVPIRLESLSLDPEQNKPRSTVEEVYQAIIDDLKKAEAMLLPVGHPKVGEPGRVTQGVAKGFLAKTYLTMASGALGGAQVTVRGGQDNGYYTYTKDVVAGHEGINSQTYFELAREKALEVIEDGDYTLYDSWKDLWSSDGRNKKEHMWSFQSLANSSFVTNIHAYFSATSSFGRGAAWFTNNHYKDYEEDDIRALDGVAHNYLSNTGGRYYYPSWEAAKYKTVGGVTYNNNGGTDDRAYVIKYADVADPLLANSDAYFPLLRYSEILLIHAEAANEINSSDSYTYLNAIRLRAHASMPNQNMSKEEFRSFVIAERAREFAMEGIRRFDLLRWGVYLQTMNQISAGQNNISKVRSKRNLLLPIPLDELNSNKAITGNNYGW